MKSRGSHAPFILFKSEQEQNEFVEQLKQCEEKVFSIEPSFWSLQAKKNMAKYGDPVIDPLFLSQAKHFFENCFQKNASL